MINRGHRSNSYMNPFIQCSSSTDTKHRTYGVFPQTNNYKTSMFACKNMYLAVFGPPLALGFLKHLHKEPDVYIYPLAMTPAKKSPLILNSFCLYSSFFVQLLVVNFSHCWAHFGPLLGAKILLILFIFFCGKVATTH